MELLLIALAVCVVLLLLLIKGVIKAFKRQAVVAIIVLIFATPFFVIWAFVELFTGDIRPRVRLD